MKKQIENEFNAAVFSSRKLLELAEQAAESRLKEQRSAAVDELARRGHYLAELADRGLIETSSTARSR